MTSAGARAYITGVYGRSPQRGPGAEPLVGSQGGEAESLSAFRRPVEVAKLPHSAYFAKSINQA